MSRIDVHLKECQVIRAVWISHIGRLFTLISENEVTEPREVESTAEFCDSPIFFLMDQVRAFSSEGVEFMVFVDPERLLTELMVPDLDVSICVLFARDSVVLARQGQQPPKILVNTWE